MPSALSHYSLYRLVQYHNQNSLKIIKFFNLLVNVMESDMIACFVVFLLMLLCQHEILQKNQKQERLHLLAIPTLP